MATQVFAAAAAALSDYSDAVSKAEGADSAADEASKARALAKKGLDLAKTAVKAAQEARSEAREALSVVERAHAAAHAAAGLSPGDPCPICARELPAGFHAPVVPGQDEAVARLTAAETAFESAREEAAAANANADQADNALESATRVRGEARKVETAARAAVGKLIEDADLTKSAGELLAPLEMEVDASTNAAKAANAAVEAHRRAIVVFDAELRPQRDALDQRRTNFEWRQNSLAQTKTQLSAERERIPTAFRPTEATTDFAPLQEALAARLSEVSGLASGARKGQRRTGRRREQASEHAARKGCSCRPKAKGARPPHPSSSNPERWRSPTR